MSVSRLYPSTARALSLAACLLTLWARGVHAQAPGWPTELGRGVDSATGRTSSPCVTGEPVLRGNREGSLGVHYDETFADYLQTTNGRLSAEVNLGIIGGGVTVDYFARVARTELSTSLTVSFDGAMGSAVLSNPRLTELGRTAASASPERRRELCGDGFFSSVDLGSRLYISVTLHFKDAETFERFVKTVKVSALFGLVKKKKTFVDETRHFAQEAYLKIDAHQEGGDPSRLRAMLAANTSLCRLDDLDACHALLTRLLGYAGSPGGYLGQFSHPYAPGELVALGFHGATYAATGIEELAAQRTPADDAYRALLRRLADVHASEVFLRDRAGLLLSTPLSDARRAALVSFRAQAQENIDGLERALWTCQSRGPDAICRDAVDRAIRERKPLLAADLYF